MMRRSAFRRAGWLTAVAAAISFQTPASATPFNWGDDLVKPLRWPAGATINVWIDNLDAESPRLPTRQRLFADGIERWRTELESRGYKLSVNLGTAPAGTANLVQFSWADEATGQLAGLTLRNNSAVTQPVPNAGQTAIGSGKGLIRNNLERGNAMNQEFIRNLGMHEFAHAFGLADDDAAGRVTSHNVQNDGNPMQFNDRDRAELNQLLALGGRPRGDAFARVAEPGRYVYDFAFNGDAGDHVSLITLDIEPDLVASVLAPEGWLFLDVPTDRTSPFYRGYMEDGTTDPAPWSLEDPLDYLAFRSSEPVFDLTDDNPLLTFAIETRGDRVGIIDTWAGGELQQVEGPVPIPAPATLLLMGSALAGLIGLRRQPLTGRAG